MKRIILVLLLIIVSCRISIFCQATNDHDSIALVALYDSTGGPSTWNKTKNNWTQYGVPVSQWYGITEDLEGNVISINLSGMGLSGYIPISIGDTELLFDTTILNQQNLAFLQTLDLSNNSIGGSIPYTIAGFASLTYINLSNNKLTGGIPELFGHFLGSLQTLDLHNNQLTDTIPQSLGNYLIYFPFNLYYLDLSNNQLTGTIPETLGNSTNLRVFTVYHNNLTGNIPSTLGNLTNLTYLVLGFNHLSGSIPSTLGNLTNLTVLYLSVNDLTGNIPATLGNLTNLTYLQLGSDSLTGNIPAELGNLINLRYFGLFGTKITGNIPPELGNLIGLDTLILGSNQLTGKIPTELGNLKNLIFLSLNVNELSDSIPTSIGNLSNLTSLILDANNLTGKVPTSLSHLTNLRSLSLGGNKFTFDGIDTLASIFKNIDFSYNPQDTILQIHNKDSTLLISAGGFLKNNIYAWYRDDVLDTIIVDDSILKLRKLGNYRVEITNSKATQLTLYSDTNVVNCDSTHYSTPTIKIAGDSVLLSSLSQYYQWYYNNDTLVGEKSKSLNIGKVGFYRVETSSDNLCWASSLDYPVIITRSPLSDTLKMMVYPNPTSTGIFNVDVKLPETTGITTYVTVYDVNGKQILETNKLIFFGDEIRIPVTLTTKGTFFVKVYINSDVRQQTVIIM